MKHIAIRESGAGFLYEVSIGIRTLVVGWARTYERALSEATLT